VAAERGDGGKRGGKRGGEVATRRQREREDGGGKHGTP